MAVSLYTVRIVFKILGVENYGIYTVVAGIVEVFSFLSNSMSSAAQRFFAFHLGQENKIKLKQTFSMIMIIYIMIACVILLLAETLGLWFLNYKLVIPSSRLFAANWIYQFSIISFLIGILTLPYNAIIIARENMTFFAYVSIVEVVFKLIVVYLLLYFAVDKLILYGFLITIVSCIIAILYKINCTRKFEECHFNFYWNKQLFNTLLTYSGWNLFGTVTSVANNQGINILLNLFFGPALNAARTVAFRVSYIIGSFSTNFYTALQSQIIKYYAQGNKSEMMRLVFTSSRFSYYLLLIISLPLLAETQYILLLWLNGVADYMIILTRLSLIFTLVTSLEYPLSQAARATGDIKNYQVYVGLVTLSIVPISYILLKFHLPPQATIYTMILVYIVALIVRLFILKKQIGLSIVDYILEVLKKVLLVTLASLILPYFLHDKVYSLSNFFFKTTAYIVWTIFMIILIGLDRNEKEMTFIFLKKFISKFNYKAAFSPKP